MKAQQNQQLKSRLSAVEQKAEQTLFPSKIQPKIALFSHSQPYLTKSFPKLGCSSAFKNRLKTAENCMQNPLDNQNPSSFTISSVTSNVLPFKSGNSSNNFNSADSSFEMSGGWMRNTIIPEDRDGGNNLVFKKSLSCDIKTCSSLHASEYSSEFFTPFGAYFMSMPLSDNDLTSLASTSSSAKNLNFEVDKPFASQSFSSQMQGSFYMPSCQGRVCSKDFIDSCPSFEHFKSQRNLNSSAFKSRPATADFTVSDDVFVDFSSHDTITSDEVFKTFTKKVDEK